MRIHEALLVLGVTPEEATPARIHEAYIAALRVHHPDTNPHPEAGRRSADITEAFRILSTVDPVEFAAPAPTPETGPSGDAPKPPPPTGRAGSDLWSAIGTEGFGLRVIADDTIELDLPTDLAAQFLHNAAHSVGEIIYLERSSGLMQLLVHFEDEPLCQIILDIQGRAARGTTEVFCSVASMDDRPPPPIEAVTEFIATQLAAAIPR